MTSKGPACVILDPDRLSRTAAPLFVMADGALRAVSAGARPHLARLCAEGAFDGTAELPAPAAAWLHPLAEGGTAVAPAAPGLPGLRAERLDGDPSAAAPVLAALSVQHAAGTTALDTRLAGLLDSARFIAMGELIDALEHRLNQPRAALRNRLAAVEAAQTRRPERVPDLLAQAYGDLETLFDALSAFRAEIQGRIDAGPDATARETGGTNGGAIGAAADGSNDGANEGAIEDASAGATRCAATIARTAS
jgi:signal transduction histidine kinase